MKMKRILYHFDGINYEENETVTLVFFLPRNSIKNFLELCNFGYKVDRDFQSDGTKRIVLKMPAHRMAELCQKLGKKEFDEVRTAWTVTNSFLRRERFKKQYFGYMCYNPETKRTELKTNSPFVIKGKQQVFHGKLWRRINS